MPGCCAFGCSNRDSKGFLMKRFPSDPERRKLWETKVKRDNWKAKDSSYLCEVSEYFLLLRVLISYTESTFIYSHLY